MLVNTHFQYFCQTIYIIKLFYCLFPYAFLLLLFLMTNCFYGLLEEPAFSKPLHNIGVELPYELLT